MKETASQSIIKWPALTSGLTSWGSCVCWRKSNEGSGVDREPWSKHEVYTGGHVSQSQRAQITSNNAANEGWRWLIHEQSADVGAPLRMEGFTSQVSQQNEDNHRVDVRIGWINFTAHVYLNQTLELKHIWLTLNRNNWCDQKCTVSFKSCTLLKAAVTWDDSDIWFQVAVIPVIPPIRTCGLWHQLWKCPRLLPK